MTNDPVPVNALKNADAALRAANLSPQSPLFQIVAEAEDGSIATYLSLKLEKQDQSAPNFTGFTGYLCIKESMKKIANSADLQLFITKNKIPIGQYWIPTSKIFRIQNLSYQPKK